jgi:hypothetical protein
MRFDMRYTVTSTLEASSSTVVRKKILGDIRGRPGLAFELFA